MKGWPSGRNVNLLFLIFPANLDAKTKTPARNLKLMTRALHQSEYGSYRHLPQCMIEQVPNFLSQLWYSLYSLLRSQVVSRSHRPSLCANTCMRFISMVLMQARHFFATMHSSSLVCLSPKYRMLVWEEEDLGAANVCIQKLIITN